MVDDSGDSAGPRRGDLAARAGCAPRGGRWPRRLLAALAILVGTVCLVYFDRDAYRDNNDPTGTVSLIDSIYYTTVTLSTTGYGDIAPSRTAPGSSTRSSSPRSASPSWCC